MCIAGGSTRSLLYLYVTNIPFYVLWNIDLWKWRKKKNYSFIPSSKFFTGRKNRTFINEKIIKNSLVPNQNNDNKSQIDLLFQAITRIPFPLPISKQRKRIITPNHAQTLPKNPKPLPSFSSKEKKKEHTRPPTVWSIRIRLRIEISVDETQPLRATTYDATTTAAAAATTTTTVAAAVAVAGGKVDREAEGEGARVHARTHARTVVRARGQTDRDKEHFRRCTGRPRSAYLLLLARRGRRTRGRVTPECPRFLLSTFPLPRSPVVSPDVCLSISLPIRAYVSLSLSLRLSFLRCSLYRSLVRPSSSSFHGLLPVPGVYALSPPLFSLPSPSFFFFFFAFSVVLSPSFHESLLLGSQMPGSISFYSFSTRWSCEPRIRWNWSTWTKEGDIHLGEGLAFQLSRAGVSNILLARSE